MPDDETVTETVINQLASEINQNAVDKGFWDAPDPYIAETNTKLLLIVSEAVEAMDVLRKNYEGVVNPYTRMTQTQLSEFLEELYDVIIRTFDLIYNFDHTSAHIMLAKIAKNAGRPRKHGKRF